MNKIDVSKHTFPAQEFYFVDRANTVNDFIYFTYQRQIYHATLNIG